MFMGNEMLKQSINEIEIIIIIMIIKKIHSKPHSSDVRVMMTQEEAGAGRQSL